MERYPLMWPVGFRRTSMPESNPRFRRSKTAEQELDELMKELKRLEVTDIVISCNIPLKANGARDFTAAMKSSADTGVAVYFRLHEKGQVVCCDAWDSFKHNLRALTKTIEALRGLDNWKATEIVERAFSGLKALPEHAESLAAWWDILKVDRKASQEVILKAYRTLSRKYHPDLSGGDEHQFKRLTDALEHAKKDRGFR